jgi:2-(3-amino-3-carboxypropyl)histidine synthase
VAQVPDEILHDAALNDAIAVLPANYNFEVHKTVWRLRKEGAQAVALQFPEGLLMYSCILADVFRKCAATSSSPHPSILNTTSDLV